jgi:hypothetical protein
MSLLYWQKNKNRQEKSRKDYISFYYIHGYCSIEYILEYEIKIFFDHYEDNTIPYKSIYCITLQTFPIKLKNLYLPSYKTKKFIDEECYEKIYSRIRNLDMKYICEKNLGWEDCSQVLFTDSNELYHVEYKINDVICKDKYCNEFFKIFQDVKDSINADKFVENVRKKFKEK